MVDNFLKIFRMLGLFLILALGFNSIVGCAIFDHDDDNTTTPTTSTSTTTTTLPQVTTTTLPPATTTTTRPPATTTTTLPGGGGTTTTTTTTTTTSTTTSTTTTVPVGPEAPTGLWTAVNDREVSLFWNEVTGATSYTVYWSTTVGVTTSDNKENVGNITQFNHTGLTNGTTYYYRVSASNVSGESQLSTEISAMPVEPPSGLKVTVAGTEITLSWNAALGAEGYRVQWNTDNDFPPTEDVGGSIEYTITAEPNNMYYFRVTAYNNEGYGAQAYSGSASILISDWKWANPIPNAEAIRGFAWNGSNLFAAVGDAGSLYTSPDGVSWEIKNSSTVRNLGGVASDGTKFVAVGERGTILFSPDGAGWTIESGAWGSLYDVAWNGTYFAAVGASGTILTSPDGKTWIVQTSNFPSSNGKLSRIKWLDNQFVAVGIDYTAGSGVILTSPDGIEWTSQSCAINREIEDVSWNGSIFVAIAGGDNICTSSDGATWTAETTTNNVNTSFATLIWDGSQFVLAGQNAEVHTSPDGYIWTKRYPTPSNFQKGLHAILWNGSQYVTGGYAGTILSGPDMTDWPLRSPDNATLITLTDVVSDGTRFVAVGSGGFYEGSGIVTSDDGVTWAESLTTYNSLFQGVEWNATNQFVAVGSDDTILTSPDGQTWTSQSSGTTGQSFSKAIWAGDKYIVVGKDVILTSPNGTSWTPAAISADIGFVISGIGSVTWSGNSFVAIGREQLQVSPYTSKYVAWTSDDGFSWTINPYDSFGRLDDVAWGNGTFVATGAIGYSYTSNDGLTWTQNNIGTSGYMNFVEWDGSQFVGGVAGETLYTSPDGVTWTPQYTGLTTDTFWLRSFTWDNLLNKAVAVGYNGAIIYNDAW